MIGAGCFEGHQDDRQYCAQLLNLKAQVYLRATGKKGTPKEVITDLIQRLEAISPQNPPRQTGADCSERDIELMWLILSAEIEMEAILGK